MKSFPSRVLGSVLGLALPLFSWVACSSSSPSTTPPDAGDAGGGMKDTGPAPCVQSHCLTGNMCLPDSTGLVECRLPCTTQADCPWDYTCLGVTGSATMQYCSPDTAVAPTTGKPYVENKGVWGDSCNPAGGVDNNPDCDWSQGFRCYAQSPTDGNAYCTQIYCKSDSDCRGGWWCATVNLAPNAESSARSNGQTYSVCQPRDQCAECQSDVDCDSSIGVPEHCILDKQGTHYCATECSTNDNCAEDAECLDLAQGALCNKSNMPCVCAARARECTGDGLLCSPCRSDADCKAGGGLCLLADYSTERFCGVPSTVPCTISDGMLVAMCPKTDEAPNGTGATPEISCLTGWDGVEDPPNQCVGLVKFGESGGQPIYIIGCWTQNR
jgi:hypothetical protein